MEEKRDAKWLEIYNNIDAKKFPNDDRIKVTTAIWKASKKLEEINKRKKEKSIKFIDITEVETSRQEIKILTKNKCQSQTMSGNPCKFKAISVCGRFCKKHSL